MPDETRQLRSTSDRGRYADGGNHGSGVYGGGADDKFGPDAYVGPLLARRLAWEAENPRPEPLVRAERAIVRALRDAGFGRQSQVTHSKGFVIAAGGITVHVEIDS